MSYRALYPRIILFILLMFTSLLPQDLLKDGIPANAQAGYDAISQGGLRTHLNILAGEEFSGRGNGQMGLTLAAQYLADFYRDNGFESFDDDETYLQPYEITEMSATSASLAVERDLGRGAKATDGYFLDIDFTLYNRGIQHDIDMTTDVVFVGYGISAPMYGHDDYKSVNVMNKVVLAFEGEPHRPGDEEYFSGPDKKTQYASRTSKATNAKVHGALAVLFVADPDSTERFDERVARTLPSLGKSSMAIPYFAPRRVPYFRIRETIAKSLFSGGNKSFEDVLDAVRSNSRSQSFALRGTRIKLKVEMKATAHILNNVAALLPGSDPSLKDEYLVISGHYDHLGLENGEVHYGADDNGTGTSSLLAIAAAYKNNPTPPRRSIIFLHVSAEERGLIGSRYFATYPLVDKSAIIADINIDMVGRNAPDSIYAIGTNMLSWDLHNIGEAAIKLVPDFNLNYLYNDKNDPNRFYYRSDHYNFAQLNIPITFYFAGVHEDYHKPTDTVDKIDFAKLQKVARLSYLVAYELANRDERPRLNGVLID